MAEELQNLLEKIKREGVDKAKAEAAAIIDKANAEAAAIIKNAQAQADALKVAAQTQADQDAARASETIRQAARDTMLNVEAAVTTLLTTLLTKNVDAALADPSVAAALAADAVKALIADDTAAEVVANGKLVTALQSQLAAQPNIKVVLDEAAQNGFTVTHDGGRVAHDFSGDTISNALAARLRPELAKLIK